jgi:hypothetical protein
MAKKPLITDKERTAIALAYNQNRDLKAEAIRQIASKQCGRELGLSTVQRELAKLRRSTAEGIGSTDPIDSQWSLASLKEYNLLGPSIPLLLYMQATINDNTPELAKKLLNKKGYHSDFITIREAIWFNRILTIAELDTNFSEKMTLSNQMSHKWPEWLDDLFAISRFYCTYEIACELAHISPIITSMFDAPTIDGIKYNIIKYRQGSHIFQKFSNMTDEERAASLESIDSSFINEVRKGGKTNARSHSKKR